jgi:type II secretory pathway pseudopilin PulG
MKKGISLIVLVITIIVMIILAASVVITLSNTGIINKASEAVDLTNERQVQDMAALIWAECYLDPVKKVDIVNSVKTELANQGITEDKWNITVTETGVMVTNKNGAATLGELITNPKTDYGKMVDYEANGITEWQIFYEDEANGYVFLISKNSVETRNLDAVSSPTTKEIELLNICALGQTAHRGYSSNCMYINVLIGEYDNYANKTASYKDYVVGSMGAPTIELLAAGYNAKYADLHNQITPIIDKTYIQPWEDGCAYHGKFGYFINTKGQTFTVGFEEDDLYFSGAYWLASPSAFGDYTAIDDGMFVLIVGNTTINDGEPGINEYGIRPIVCLKSDIPASAVEGGYSINK